MNPRPQSNGTPARGAGLVALVAGVVLTASAPAAHAYDSRCRIGGRDCAPGLESARHRWNPQESEHFHLWNDAIRQRGLSLPEHLTGTVTLAVPSVEAMAPTDSAGLAVTTVAPRPFAEATVLLEREFGIADMTQLPDLSYALWDWAMGNETCPIGGDIPTDLCHNFLTHMGGLNSSHFLPQAEGFYTYYHDLALSRAAECGDMRSVLADEFPAFVEECDQEAFAYEAIAHHYLQDAWSMGHMWERWGGPNVSDFGGGQHWRERAMLVAMSAGLIHGARALLQDKVGPGGDALDPLCAPLDPADHPMLFDDAWATYPPPSYIYGADGGRYEAVGDLYLEDLRSTYGVQYGRLIDCAGSSLNHVADAAGLGSFGRSPGSTPGTSAFSQDCFSQRATNTSMYLGAGSDVILNGIGHVRVEMDDWASTFVTLGPAAQEAMIDVPERMADQLRNDLVTLATRLRANAAVFPDDTSMATWRLPPLLGVARNSTARYQHDPPADYSDPRPQFSPAPTGMETGNSAASRHTVLARAFHRSHAREWCDVMGQADLEAVRENAGANCALCEEFAVRHMRVGESANAYDASQEPLCHHLSASPAYLYQPGSQTGGSYTRAEAATDWCGCGEDQNGCGGTIGGRIVDAEDRAPIAGANVSFQSDEAAMDAESGEDGTFMSPSLACGDNEVVIEAPGYVPATLHVEINEDGDQTQLVELAAIDEDCMLEDARIMGTVLDALTAAALPSANLILREGHQASMSAQAIAMATTDPDGAYGFEGLTAGYYTLVATADGYDDSGPRAVSA